MSRSGVVVVLAASLALSCGGQAQKVSQPASDSRAQTAASADADPDPFDRAKNEIADFDREIREWRAKIHMSTEPGWSAIQQTVRMSVTKIRTCPESPDVKSTECDDVCTIAEAICDNAESICRIAGELDGDPWANEKCNSAKASCQEATAKCCECAAAEADGAAGRRPD